MKMTSCVSDSKLLTKLHLLCSSMIVPFFTGKLTRKLVRLGKLFTFVVIWVKTVDTYYVTLITCPNFYQIGCTVIREVKTVKTSIFL